MSTYQIVGWIVYTIIWLIIWITILRYRNKDFDALHEEFEKFIDEYETLKEEYNKLEGRYEECQRIMQQGIPNSEPTLRDTEYLPN